jgi:hypothetical protein
MLHGDIIHVHMQIADVQNGEAVKGRRQLGKPHVVSLNKNTFGVWLARQ